jgi:adenylosuccinate synthase
VAGKSGPLRDELTWEEVGNRTGKEDLKEFTTVTQKLRRVGEFDAHLAKRAVSANRPDRVVLNHMDYVGDLNELRCPGSRVQLFLDRVIEQLGPICWVGFSPLGVVDSASGEAVGREFIA